MATSISQYYTPEANDQTTPTGSLSSDMSICDTIASAEPRSIDDGDDDSSILWETLGHDIYNNLREAETKRRPCAHYMETVQKDITPVMRVNTVDWLVGIADDFELSPEVIHLTVNYMDRYLSGNSVSRQSLELLGVACMLIAAKHEARCNAVKVERLCYLRDKNVTLRMEVQVLRFLKYEMTVPTTCCFLNVFVVVAQECREIPSPELGSLADDIAKLSLLEYKMLCYSPSMIAAACVFLANYMMQPTKSPWSDELSCYTRYQPSELRRCVKDLHASLVDDFSGFAKKQGEPKYKFLAWSFKQALMMPEDYFVDQSDCKPSICN